MLVIYASYTSNRTKGYLSRYLIEISPVVYIGHVTARTRDDFLKYFKENLTYNEKITIMWNTNNAQGYKIEQFGENDRIATIDGIYLINKPHKSVIENIENINPFDEEMKPEQNRKPSKIEKRIAVRRYKRRI